MGKRCNPMLIKSALTYDIGEAAQALGVTSATIRNWIKDGLPVMSERKPHLILGDALKSYLRAKRKTSKRPLDADQLFCPSCSAGRRPVGLIVTAALVSPSTQLLKGICPTCGRACSRIISTRDIDTFTRTFNIAKGANGEP
jgi:hypothetical protein